MPKSFHLGQTIIILKIKLSEIGKKWKFLYPSNISVNFFIFNLFQYGCGSVGFTDGSMDKESTCDAGDKKCGFDPCVGKIPLEWNGNLLHYSCLRTPWTEEAIVHRVAKIQTWLSIWHMILETSFSIQCTPHQYQNFTLLHSHTVQCWTKREWIF